MSIEKKHVLGGAVGVGGLVALANNPAGLSSSINAFSLLATGIATGTKTAVTNILGTKGATFVGSLAPFAAPVVGGFAGYKLAKAAGIESKAGRTVVGLIPGIGAGAALLGKGALLGSFAPLVLAGGAAYMGYRGLKRLGSRGRRRSNTPVPTPA